MSWDCLSAEVACMFADYTWRADEYQQAIERKAAHALELERARRRDPWVRLSKRRWQKRNPEKMAAYRDQWRKKNPDAVRKYNRLAKKRRKARDPDKYREQKRKRERAYYARNAEKRRAYFREQQRIRRRQGGKPLREQRCRLCRESGHNRSGCPQTT